MAITINTSPAIFSPVFTPLWFQVTSSNIAQSNFRFVFDTFTGNTPWNSMPISRNRMWPDPNTVVSEYSPSRILESYLTFEAYPKLIGTTGSTNPLSYNYYTIAIGEEYGSLTTGTTTYSGLTFFTGITFNSTIQYDKVETWATTGHSQYIMSGTGIGTVTEGRFLSNSKVYIPGIGIVNGKRIRTSDYITLSFWNDTRIANRAKSFWVRTVANSGTSRVTAVVLTNVTGATETQIKQFGIGPMNLSGLTTGDTLLNTAISVPDLRDNYYTITLQENAGAGYAGSTSATSETYYFLLDNTQTKYTAKSFVFQNRLGQAEYLDFNLVSKKQISAERDIFQKSLDWNYRIGQRGNTITDIRAKETLKVTSNWINECENIQIEEFLTSPEVFLFENGELYPYIITTSSIDFKQQVIEKMINYTFELQPAYAINTQRAGRPFGFNR